MRMRTVAIGLYLTFFGSAAAQIPDGYEVVVVVEDSHTKGVPRLNDCGEIVFHYNPPAHQRKEIYRYDNGVLERVTFVDPLGAFRPDVNDGGVITYSINDLDFVDGIPVAPQVAILNDGVQFIIGGGLDSTINNAGHVAWEFLVDWSGCAEITSIMFYDGNRIVEISDGNQSNQGCEINDVSEITWTEYDFCDAGPLLWFGHIMHYDGMDLVQLNPEGQNASGAFIDNAGQVTWTLDGPDIDGSIMAYTADGIVELTEGYGGRFNDLGHMAFLRWHDDEGDWEVWLMRPTAGGNMEYRLTDNDFHEGDGDINNWGEVTWWRITQFVIEPSGVHYMRRIRTGEADFDGDVDLLDFATFQRCMTGPVDTPRLCDCRFLDMDHDRDVDLDDFVLHQAALTGPVVP